MEIDDLPIPEPVVEAFCRLVDKLDPALILAISLDNQKLFQGHRVILKNVPEDYLQQVLMIEIPRQLFPFARRIISDVTRDGGMMPLMLEPIDFVALYRKKMAETAGQRVAS